MASSSNAQSWPAPPARGKSNSVTSRARGSRHCSVSGSQSTRQTRQATRSRDEEPNILSGPAGPQERQEWLDAFDNVSNGMKTIGNASRKHTQELVTMEAEIQELNTRLV